MEIVDWMQLMLQGPICLIMDLEINLEIEFWSYQWMFSLHCCIVIMVICFIFINGDIYIFQIRRADRTNNQTATTQAVRSGAHKNPPATTFRWMLDVRFHNPKLFPNPLFHLTLRSSTNLFFITIFLGFYSSISITAKHCYWAYNIYWRYSTQRKRKNGQR